MNAVTTNHPSAARHAVQSAGGKVKTAGSQRGREDDTYEETPQPPCNPAIGSAASRSRFRPLALPGCPVGPELPSGLVV
jgi:hypothetical protein